MSISGIRKAIGTCARAALVAAVCGAGASGGTAAAGTDRVPRVAFLATGSAEASASMVENFREGLRSRGWDEGRTVIVDYRFAEGRTERLPVLARELMRQRPDVVVAAPSSAVIAAKRASGTVPLVMANVSDPVGLGLVASLARPGGNVTGLAYSFDVDVWGKQLQILREAVPEGTRLGVLYNPDNPGASRIRDHAKATAATMNLTAFTVEARRPEDFDAAFAALQRARVDMVLVLSDPMFGSHAGRLAQLSTRHRLPTMHGARSNVLEGGLLFYGPNLPAQLRQAADYVDRILKGASPATLPVEQPTQFDLIVNARTAKAIGIALPPALRMRADQVIE